MFSRLVSRSQCRPTIYYVSPTPQNVTQVTICAVLPRRDSVAQTLKFGSSASRLLTVYESTAHFIRATCSRLHPTLELSSKTSLFRYPTQTHCCACWLVGAQALVLRLILAVAHLMLHMVHAVPHSYCTLAHRCEFILPRWSVYFALLSCVSAGDIFVFEHG